jgi:hypothetical protein
MLQLRLETRREARENLLRALEEVCARRRSLLLQPPKQRQQRGNQLVGPLARKG